MQDNNYVVFEIIGVKHDGFVNSFVFSQDAVCEISNDKFIRKVVVSADISNATFYLHDYRAVPLVPLAYIYSIRAF